MVKSKSAIVAAGIIASMGMSSAAYAQSDAHLEVRVGIIGVGAPSSAADSQAVSIEGRSYTREGYSSLSQGDLPIAEQGQRLIGAFVQQSRQIDQDSRIRIYSADVLQKKDNATGIAASVNWEGATKALQWFKENNVNVVLTAFNGQDTQGMRDFVQESERLGMTIFASAGNKVGGPSYPAQYMETISVAADNPDFAFRNDPNVSSWVDFTLEGNIAGPDGNKPIDSGSSYATAKAAAFGAYYSAHNPNAGRNDILNALHEVAVQVNYEVDKQQVMGFRIDEKEAGIAIAQVARGHSNQAQAETDHSPASISAPKLAMAQGAGESFGR